MCSFRTTMWEKTARFEANFALYGKRKGGKDQATRHVDSPWTCISSPPS